MSIAHGVDVITLLYNGLQQNLGVSYPDRWRAYRLVSMF